MEHASNGCANVDIALSEMSLDDTTCGVLDSSEAQQKLDSSPEVREESESDQEKSESRPSTPPLLPEHKRVSDSESSALYESNCEALLCVVKTAGTRKQNAAPQESYNHEFDFLRKVTLEHANIVQYFEITNDYIFMEHCVLGSLDHYLKPSMSPPVLEWTLQLCSALAYIHDLGWAHNQLYPCNVLVAKGGAVVKICDFGGVTAIEDEAQSPPFDIYCLGLLIWFMQHGGKSIPSNPIKNGGDSPNIMHSHFNLIDVSGLQLSQTMRACWSQPNVRPTAAALVEELLNLRTTVSLGDYETSPSTIPSNVSNEVENGSSLVRLENNPDVVFEARKIDCDEIRRRGPDLADQLIRTSSKVRLGVVKIPREYDCLDQFWAELKFLREVKPQHPHIAQYLETTNHYIFMEYCPLGSLDRYLTPEIKPPVIEWTLQLCSALTYLHGLGFAHNNLVPYQILVARGGLELQLCDFGTVTPADDFQFGYAPELVLTRHQKRPPDWQHPRGDVADIYSLGLIVWYMQQGGKEIPDNHVWTENGYLDAMYCHLDMLDVTGLLLADLMRDCWAHHKSRPTAAMLLERLHTLR